MSDTTYTQALNVAAGLFLLAAFGMLSRRQLTGMIRLFAVQGLALTAIVVLLGLRHREWELLAVACGLFALRVLVLPYLSRRALGSTRGDLRETNASLHVGGSLIAGGGLVLLAYVVTQPLSDLAPSPETAVLPIAVSVVLLGLLALATRRTALSQVMGFLLLDNGITATAFLATSGVPLIVELGVSFDLLLVVVVLQVMTVRMRAMFGTTDLDGLRELHD